MNVDDGDDVGDNIVKKLTLRLRGCKQNNVPHVIWQHHDATHVTPHQNWRGDWDDAD
ncbi:hypothetical protein TEQG_06661 [Trichophyton equinum CBS 127.97]|uniref:Uncharacterized protein n=1 Tax=Trichophyton equinum (strain ATCC MYA-4606 / CBS 127.97) TaxID=559882 RepID=F2Q0L0_TRIEC|nr:hypothetical protein TEQG_06661 [Trichophyton equinum CBS 127.97]